MDVPAAHADRVGGAVALSALVQRIAGARQLGTVITQWVINVGYEDCNVRLDCGTGSFVVKVFSSVRSHAHSQRVVDAVTQVMAAGVRHPRLIRDHAGAGLHRDQPTGCDYMVMELVDGATFHGLGRPLTDDELRGVVEQAALIHSTDLDLGHVFDPWAVPNLAALSDTVRCHVDREMRAVVDAVAEQMSGLDIARLPHMFVHGDLTKGNVMLAASGGIVVLDFAVANLYPRIQEFAVIAANLMYGDPRPLSERAMTLAGMYDDDHHLTPREWAALEVYTHAAVAMEFLGAVRQRFLKGDRGDETTRLLELGRASMEMVRDELVATRRHRHRRVGAMQSRIRPARILIGAARSDKAGEWVADEAASDWVARTTDEVLVEAGQRSSSLITCASGISPSGPIHLGNLREIMVPHLVADELARRDAPVRHILSWDDYDRLRKVPAGIPDLFAEHVARPLSAIPDPCGEHESWAEHFKSPLRAALAELGVGLVEISQTEMYTSGAYRTQIVTAMRRRHQIHDVLDRYRTKRDAPDDEERGSDLDYYPFRPYCSVCGRDDTTVTAFDDDTTELTYRCACGAVDGPRPIAEVAGKLAWKVDWPMRWAFENVTFEAAGVDHSSPGSSFTVGSELVRQIYGAEPPHYVMYSFVGTSGGSTKMSGSAGGAPTPTDALRVLEPALLRWLYARRRPNQAITIAFDQEVNRTYDEWDALTRRVIAGTATPLDRIVQERAADTATAPVRTTPRPLPFRALASIADITGGETSQVLRILRDLTPDDPITTLDQAQPRFSCARTWITDYVAPQDRTQVRAEPDTDALSGLADSEQHALKLLVGGLADNWTVDKLTTLLYGIPKIQQGLPLDTPPTPELKAAQRCWFILLYRLLVAADTGPRLPTLLLALGIDRVRALLAP